MTAVLTRSPTADCGPCLARPAGPAAFHPGPRCPEDGDDPPDSRGGGPAAGGGVCAPSLYAEAYRHAERHKWIESEKRGYDVGEGAIREWYGVHWARFCRECRLEHIAGRRYWGEFGPETFGCLYELIVAGDLLADRLLDRVDEGWENLTILLWAREWGLPMTRVVPMLEKIDVNRARMDPGRL